MAKIITRQKVESFATSKETVIETNKWETLFIINYPLGND